MTWQVMPGDCLAILPTLAESSIDACVTDPPYHLASIVKRFGADDAAPAKSSGATGVYARSSKGFMGKTWDGGDIAMRPETWAEVLRVLKPGAHLIALCGTRTEHRVVCAIEDAGFEIRDRILWLYGSGFPKSHNVSKAIDKEAGAIRKLTREGTVRRDGYGDDWDTGSSSDRPRYDDPATEEAARWEGWGTALKPAVEIGVLARKPLSEGTIAANVLRWGTGALNIDGCRVGTTRNVPASHSKTASSIGAIGMGARRLASELDPNLGRWPANIATDGSDEVLAAFPDAPGQMADASSSDGHKTQNVYGAMRRGNGRDGEASADSENDGAVGFKMKPGARRSDSGSAARFFARFPPDDSRLFYHAKANAKDRAGSKHPTVKPVALMRWLVRMITPPGGTVLDPFAGSGTTGQAAIEEGFDAILIEREAEYLADIERRRIVMRDQQEPVEALPLFGAPA